MYNTEVRNLKHEIIHILKVYVNKKQLNTINRSNVLLIIKNVFYIYQPNVTVQTLQTVTERKVFFDDVIVSSVWL